MQDAVFIARGDGRGRFIISIKHNEQQFTYPEPVDFATMLENLEWARTTLGLKDEQALIDPFAIEEAASVDLLAKKAYQRLKGQIACLSH